jgi:peptidoglycan hydrolase-like protein with peptidoglycan-binding domain
MYVTFEHAQASTHGIVSGNHTSPFLDNLTNIFNPLVPHALYWNTQAPFGVTVSNSQLSGFLWGDSVGWIALNCSDLGSCGSQQFKVANDGNGNLSGYAWGENTGWISFSCANPETNNCNLNNNARVTISPTNGTFSGYAWSENFGWLVFDCGASSSCVKTTWRKRSSGGGGGGGGSIKKIIKPTFTPPPTVTPTQTDKVCTPLLTQYIEFGRINEEESVRKLELFLNTHQGESLVVNGVYESIDVEAVKRFQWKYREDILDPWRLRQPTGYVYITTLAKINSYQCGSILKDQTTCPYFTYYHKIGDVGGEVKKIQNFLNSTMNTGIPENGLFDEKTFSAVKVFQGAFFSSILSDWGLTSPTGKWGITTKRKANELIGCKEAPLYLDVLKKTLR